MCVFFAANLILPSLCPKGEKWKILHKSAQISSSSKKQNKKTPGDYFIASEKSKLGLHWAIK